MNPPPEIVGPLTRQTAPEIKAMRTQWILARRAEGCTLAQIASALTIDLARVHQICRKADPGRKRAPRPLTNRNISQLTGVRLGSIGATFNAMPPEAREKLALAAGRHGRSVADFLIESYMERSDAATTEAP